MDLQTTEFEGPGAFQAQVVALCQRLEDVRRIDWVDADFDRWPLSEPVLLDALSQWARAPGRQLRLLAHRYEALRQRHPRFVEWRRTYGHQVDARSPEEAATELPCELLFGGRRAIVVHDRTRWLGSVIEHPPSVHGLARALEPIWERSTAAFSATVLGL